MIDSRAMEATTTTTRTGRAAGWPVMGWPIVGWATLAVVVIQLTILGLVGTGEEGVRMAIRASARTSATLFGLAFVASSAYRLWPGAFTRWLLANRRYLGVSFACSHAIHLAAIIALAATFGRELSAVTVIVGGFGYVVLAAMTATSFDRTTKWLGARRWRALHGFGARYLWLVFFLTYLPKPGVQVRLFSSLFFGWIVVTAVIRAAAWWKERSATAVSRASG